MGALTKVAGTWRNVEVPYIKVAGTWKPAESAWIKSNGQWNSWFLQGGLVDLPFANSVGFAFSSLVVSAAHQSDGKVVVVGSFDTFNGTTVNKIVRLNLNSTLDTAFLSNTGTGANDWVRAVAIQPDGKIVIAGNFTSFNGTTANRVIRLNSNGTIDTTFLSNIGSGFDLSGIGFVGLQSDGKILLGGYFTSFNGVAAKGLVRLNSDGTLDTAFNTNLGTGPNDFFGTIHSMAVQTDGKILAVGGFSSFNGVTAGGVIRLNSNGTVDTAFAANVAVGGDSSSRGVSIQSDGKILVGGVFSTFNNISAGRLVRLNSDGTLDSAFLSNIGTGANNQVHIVMTQPNDKILIGGNLTSFNGSSAGYFLRLNSDGTVDTAFLSNSGGGLESRPWGMALQTDGKIILCGQFSSFNGVNSTRNIVRIGGDVAL